MWIFLFIPRSVPPVCPPCRHWWVRFQPRDVRQWRPRPGTLPFPRPPGRHHLLPPDQHRPGGRGRRVRRDLRHPNHRPELPGTPRCRLQGGTGGQLRHYRQVSRITAPSPRHVVKQDQSSQLCKLWSHSGFYGALFGMRWLDQLRNINTVIYSNIQHSNTTSVLYSAIEGRLIKPLNFIKLYLHGKFSKTVF